MTGDQALRPLRRKLTSTLVALGLLGVLVIAVTSYAVVQWREEERTLSRHYARSLRLQEVRALTFESYKEVTDAVLGGDDDFREEYAREQQEIDEVFEDWARFVDDDAEQVEVDTVRAAVQRLDDSAQEVFDLVDAGRQGEAVAALEAVEADAFEPFVAVTTAAVEGDRDTRRAIRATSADARQTVTLVLVLAALGVLSLLLLVGAYLSGGVFTPIRALRDALRAVNGGERGVRVPEEGDDEVAQVNREFNALAASVDRRGAPDGDDDGAPGGAATSDDAQLVLHRLVGGLRRDAAALPTAADGTSASATASALVARIDALADALGRSGALAHAVDLRLAPLAPAALLHEVVGRFEDEVVRRSVSCDIDVDPAVGPLVVDRARLREALGELVRNALDALPSSGGRLRLTARRGDDRWVALEVADDGSGISEEDVSWLYDGGGGPRGSRDRPRGVGLRLATSAVEQHRGRLQLQTVPAGGTTARILLPPGSSARPREGTP